MKILFITMIIIASLSYAEITGDIVAEYLDELADDLSYQRDGNEFVLVTMTQDSVYIPYMYILADPEQEGCLLVAFSPGVIPESGAERTVALEALAELNWNNTWAKFVSDPVTGEVSVMYTFTTESGLGFESFAVVINVLLGTVEENWEVLMAL